MPTQELDKQKLEIGPATPEITGEAPEISDTELARILETSQNAVAANGHKLEGLDVEILAFLAEINAGALEQGEANRLLGEVKIGQAKVEQTVQSFAEQVPDKAPQGGVVDLGHEATVQSEEDLEAEMLRLMEEEQKSHPVVPELEVEKKKTTGTVLEESVGSKEAINSLIKEKMATAAAEKRLDQAREFLLAAEKTDKKKSSPEYAAILKEYQEARAEVVGGKVDTWLDEQIKLVDARAQEKKDDKNWLSKGYDAYKKLGEWNLGALLKSDEKLRTKEDDTATTRVLKGVGRFATRTVSVRSAVSLAMLGAGLYFGAGAAVGAGAIAGRRVFSGLGAGIGSYDLMKMFSDKRAEGEKGMRKNLTDEEADVLTDEELVERMSHFEAHGALNGIKVGENEIYRLLQDRLKERALLADLDDLMTQKDSQIEAITGKSKSRDNKMKIAGAAVGLLVGGGGVAAAIKDYFGSQAPTGSNFEFGTRQAGAAPLEQSAPKTVAPVDVPRTAYVDVENPAVGTVPEMQVVAEPETDATPAADTANVKLKGVVKVPGGVANVPDYNAKFVDTLDKKPNITSTADTLKPEAEIKPATIAAADTAGVKLKDLNAGKAPEAAVVPKEPEAALGAKAASVESPSPKHFEYQGGKSVWNELAKQYEKRFPDFDKLSKAEQTYLIDQVKDKIVAHHGELGLADIDHVQGSELKAVDWDKVFSDAKMDSPHLSPEQIANIDHPPVHEAAAVPETKDVFTAPESTAVSPEAMADSAEAPSAMAETAVTETPTAPEAASVAAESVAPAAFEKTAQTLVAEKLHQNWTPEKLKTFMYLHEAEAARLSGKPDLLQSKLQEFNKLTQDLTERVKTGSLKDTGLTGAHAAHGAKGETFLLQQHGKDGWRIWQVKEGNQVQSIVEQKKGLFGLGKKNVDIFDSKGVKEILGYNAEAKGAAAAQELAQAKIKKAMTGQPHL